MFLSLPLAAQVDKELVQPELSEEPALPVMQRTPEDPAPAPVPERPSFIEDTHLPPPHKKKEFEEAEKKAYIRPEPILPASPEK